MAKSPSSQLPECSSDGFTHNTMHNQSSLRYFQKVGTLTLALLNAPLWAASTSNLIVNPDAETGDLTGWTTSSGLAAVSSSTAGTSGLSNSATVGNFVFSGGTNNPTATATQTVSLAAYAADINTGNQPYELSAALQSRGLFNGVMTIIDTAQIEFTFRDNNGAALAPSIVFIDNPPLTLYDWDEFSATGLIPVGATELFIEMTSSRSAGQSTDSYIDSVGFQLTPIPEPTSALLLVIGLFSGLRRSR